MKSTSKRDFWIQAIGLAIFLGLIGAAVWTTWNRLVDQGIATGFDILGRETAWRLSNAPLGHEASDPYWLAFANALANTFILGMTGIVFSTLLGVAIGFGRVMNNPAVRAFCTIYVEIFRNVPLVVQVVFWYGVFLRFPTVRDAIEIGNVLILSNRGLALPGVQAAEGSSLWLIFLVVLALMIPVGWWIRRRLLPSALKVVICGALALALVGIVATLLPGFDVELPVAGRFSYDSGFILNIEFAALAFGIIVFSAAYIGEIVRGGLESVDRGQVEAARAIGLTETQVFWDVRLPLALRSIVPPIGNQYIFTMKATALGSAVGYSELFTVSVVGINQTGRTMEFIFLMMALYVLINFTMTRLVNWLNRAVALRGHS